MLGVVRGGTGAPSGMRTFPAAVQCILRCNKDAGILVDIVHLQEQPSKVGPETALECVRRAIWGMLYADDACIVSRHPFFVTVPWGAAGFHEQSERIQPSILSTCPLHTNSGCGKERRILIGPW